MLCYEYNQDWSSVRRWINILLSYTCVLLCLIDIVLHRDKFGPKPQDITKQKYFKRWMSNMLKNPALHHFLWYVNTKQPMEWIAFLLAQITSGMFSSSVSPGQIFQRSHTLKLLQNDTAWAAGFLRSGWTTWDRYHWKSHRYKHSYLWYTIKFVMIMTAVLGTVIWNWNHF